MGSPAIHGWSGFHILLPAMGLSGECWIAGSKNVLEWDIQGTKCSEHLVKVFAGVGSTGNSEFCVFGASRLSQLQDNSIAVLVGRV
jgi:hypothetical protein